MTAKREKKEKDVDTFVFYLNDWNDYNYLIIPRLSV